ncbi:hypothetical protein G7Y79_00022g051740 [Physcia stellaris]|nr:hypothetical protein G7Y79_00022g051740 [Physcia stellaris]
MLEIILGFCLVCIVLATDPRSLTTLQPSTSSAVNESDYHGVAALSFMHYHLNTTISKDTSLSTNDQTRLMNKCTGTGMRDWVFQTSRCLHPRNLQALEVTCRDHHFPWTRAIPQACAANEICMDTGLAVEDAKAYCVSTRSFTKIRQSYGPLARSIEIPNPGAGTVSANAVLADWTRRMGMGGANPFKLDALGRGSSVAKKRILTESILKSEECVGCFSLRMQPLPRGTRFLRAGLAVNNAQEGYMFLVTIS